MYVNAPRYLMRKYCLLRLIKNQPKCSVLDIGCGAGDLCSTLYQLGFNVKGLDYSQEAIALCRKRAGDQGIGHDLAFTNKDFNDLQETFDVIILCEVLEHINKDEQALKKIYSLLNPGGALILSVPAHQKWYGAHDRWAGHVRRYDQKILKNLLGKCDFNVEKFWNYGFPLANLTEIIRNRLYAKKEYKSLEDATKKSGIDRQEESKFGFLFNPFFVMPFCWLQMLFLKVDISTGYLVKAVKKIDKCTFRI